MAEGYGGEGPTWSQSVKFLCRSFARLVERKKYSSSERARAWDIFVEGAYACAHESSDQAMLEISALQQVDVDVAMSIAREPANEST